MIELIKLATSFISSYLHLSWNRVTVEILNGGKGAKAYPCCFFKTPNRIYPSWKLSFGHVVWANIQNTVFAKVYRGRVFARFDGRSTVFQKKKRNKICCILIVLKRCLRRPSAVFLYYFLKIKSTQADSNWIQGNLFFVSRSNEAHFVQTDISAIKSKTDVSE